MLYMQYAYAYFLFLYWKFCMETWIGRRIKIEKKNTGVKYIPNNPTPNYFPVTIGYNWVNISQ